MEALRLEVWSRENAKLLPATRRIDSPSRLHSQSFTKFKNQLKTSFARLTYKGDATKGRQALIEGQRKRWKAGWKVYATSNECPGFTGAGSDVLVGGLCSGWEDVACST